LNAKKSKSFAVAMKLYLGENLSQQISYLKFWHKCLTTFTQKKEWTNHHKNGKSSETDKKEFIRVDGLQVEN
jgi:hypothetical protein